MLCALLALAGNYDSCLPPTEETRSPHWEFFGRRIGRNVRPIGLDSVDHFNPLEGMSHEDSTSEKSRQAVRHAGNALSGIHGRCRDEIYLVACETFGCSAYNLRTPVTPWKE